MITSTTELLNELTEVSPQNPGAKLLPQTSQMSEASQKLRKEFATRYGCMQSWYLRCSWVQKIKWLMQLLQGLRSPESLSTILNTLKGAYSKSTVYAGCQYSTDFVYDKALQDHNRTIHKKVLTGTQASDLEWFKTLQDSEQILMLIGLIRLGGGSIMQQIYQRGVKLYHHKGQEVEHTVQQDDGVVEIKAETPPTHMSEYNIHGAIKKRHSTADELPPPAPRILSIKPDDVNEPEVYDPGDPYVVEVENRRNIWNNMITKYRIQVEGKPPKVLKGKGKKGGTSSKSSKSGKSSKKSGKSPKTGKSAKSSKSGESGKSRKKEKKGRKGADEELDQIQLLPIWIVKKIFNYLDTKTLKKAKNVNKYWAYAIADLQNEQKARRNLDKFICKMEAGVVSPQVQHDAKPKILRDVYDTLTPKKRLLKLSERGATLPKLKGKFEKPLVKRCLATDAVKQMPESYILPVPQVRVFPRRIARAAQLYKAPSCMINELGFTKIYFGEAADEDGEKTYTTATPSETVQQSGQNNVPVCGAQSQSKATS